MSASRSRRRERSIWQRRCYEHQIRDEHDLAAHIDCIHWNPVKHGWVQRATDWPHTLFHHGSNNVPAAGAAFGSATPRRYSRR